MRHRIIKVNFSDQLRFGKAVKLVAGAIKAGGVVAHPTDTCYGLAVDIFNPRAVEKIYWLKGRSKSKPLSVIVNDEIMFGQYGKWSRSIVEVMAKNSRRQFTFVVKRKGAVPAHFNPGVPTLGMQIPKYKFSLALLKEIKGPLAATSANVSGWPNCYSAAELRQQFGQVGRWPDLIIDGGVLLRRSPSRVVLVEGNKIKVLRY